MFSGEQAAQISLDSLLLFLSLNLRSALSRQADNSDIPQGESSILLPFKWQRIMFVCWRDRIPYDETTHLNSLKRRGSHLAYKLNQDLPKAA
jgi:hypothetical protein